MNAGRRCYKDEIVHAEAVVQEMWSCRTCTGVKVFCVLILLFIAARGVFALC